MWVDDGGVAHTVALPDPTDVMADDFRADFDALALSDLEALQLVIGRAEEQAYESGWFELSASEEYVGSTPPVALLRGRVLSAGDVASAIEQTDLRWRLDVIMALDDYIS